MILRDYQTKAINDIRAAFQSGARSPIAVLPTGSGKTVIFSEISRLSQVRGNRVLVVVHRAELLRQAVDKLQAVGVEPGIIKAGVEPDYNRTVQVGSVQTLLNRLDKFTPDLIILDEAAHATAKTWRTIIDQYPDALRIGFTATPARADQTGLGDVFDSMVLGPTVADLTTRGFLCHARYFAPAQIDRSGLRIVAGDFDRAEAEIRARRITGDAVATYQRLARGRQAMAFCVSVAHSKLVAAEFCMAGVMAEHIDGAASDYDRQDIMRRFRDREIRVVCSVDLFGEGLDIPGIEAAILLRPTTSLSLHIQQIGRALRPAPGKTEALILDHAGNCIEHGLADEPRSWDLQGAKRKRDPLPAASRCPSCFAMWAGSARICPQCLEERPLTEREVKEQAGELEELTARKNTAERKNAGSYPELVAIGKQRGYKNPKFWATMVLKGRRK